MPVSTSNQFSDNIITRYLYGNGGKPRDLASEAILTRSPGASTSIDVNDYMDGPGRFASPVFFEIVNKFFSMPTSQLLELIDKFVPNGSIPGSDGNPLPNQNIIYDEWGNIYLTKNAVIVLFQVESAALNFHQAFFHDSRETPLEYFQRSFIWGSSAFKISDSAIFRLDANGSNRKIENFAVEPRQRQEDFDFEGGPFSEIFQNIGEPLLDPFHIGSTVKINITGAASTVTYAQADFVRDYSSRPFTLGGMDYTRVAPGSFSDWAGGTAALGANYQDYFQRLYDQGVLQYSLDGYDLYYGSDEADELSSYGTVWRHQGYYPSQPKGAWIIGGPGDDKLRGDGLGADNKIHGGEGNDQLTGGAGKDELKGGEGADRLYGLAGDDTLLADEKDTEIAGGVGTDILDYSASAVPIDWQAARAVVSGIEKVIGSEHDDVFALSTTIFGIFDEETEINGNGGDDRIVGNSADNKLNGGEGDDKIEGKDGDDRLDGGEGDDEIKGNEDDDHLQGGAGDDKLEGSEGEDVLRGGAGKDFLSGGGDKDEMFGGDGDDLMSGDAGEDRMFGEAGADRILGGEGDDYVHAGEGDDLVGGGDGKDLIYGDEGNDRLFGEGGEDRLFGGVGDDIMSGGEGEDILNGESGNDILDAALNDSSVDILKGEGGRDIFLVNSGDRILDLERGDRIKLGGLWLNGGEKKLPPQDPCNPEPSRDDDKDGTYKGSDGSRYTLSGSTLTVSAGGQQIVLENFQNNDGGIRLRPERTRQDQAECQRDPLILDLNGDRKVYDKLADSNAYFDLDNDGFAEHVAWAQKGDGLLVLDWNGNGRIDDGTELFGSNYTQLSGGRRQPAGMDGFTDLARLDSNGDYAITAADFAFHRLQVWIDADGDGVTRDGELKSLAELGIVSISLSARASNAVVCGCDGTTVPLMADVLRADGSSLLVYDAFLAIDQYDTREVNPVDVPDALRGLPFLIGSGTLSDLDVAMARDPGLEQLVREFAALDLSRAAEIPVLVEEIILRWTGADSVRPDSRGAAINAQWLAALEKMSGSDFHQAAVGSNPRADAAAMLIEDWHALTRRVTAELLGQTSLGDQLMPGLRYAAAAFFQVDDGTTLSSVLSNLVANRPEGGLGDQAQYWHAMTATLLEYRTGFGATESQILAAIGALPEVKSLGLTAAELAALSVAGEANGVVIGTGRTISGTTGADVILSNVAGATLNGASGDDVYILSSAASGTKIVDQAGNDRLVLLDQARASITVTAQFAAGSVFDGNSPTALRIIFTNPSTGWTAELAGRLTKGTIELDCETIDFADQKGVSLVDVLPKHVVGEDGRKIYFGSNEDASLRGSTGDDIIVGGGNADSYRLDATSGHDRINDRGSPDGVASADRLFIDSDRDSVTFEVTGEVGESLLVRNAAGQSVTIVRQWNAAKGVELFEFADGTSMTAQEVKALLLTGTTGADRIEGTSDADLIDGLGGGDVLKGNSGDDIYVFERGYGLMTVVDPLGLNRIRFGADIGKEDISLERRPDGMLLSIIGTSDAVFVGGGRSYQNLMLDFAEGPISVIDLILSLASPGQLPEDGVIRGSSKTDYYVEGTPGNDVIDGLGGDETLYGYEGDDTYVYSSGEKSIREYGGFDVIRLAPDLTFDRFILLDRMITFEGSLGYVELDNYINSDGTAAPDYRNEFIEGLIFADGRTLNIAGGKILAGGDGDDILFSFGTLSETFTPGRGNDRIFASENSWGESNGTKTIVLGPDFGHDVFYPGTDFQLDLSAFTLDSSVGLRRDGYDLVVSTDDGANDIRVKRVFDPHQPWEQPFTQSGVLFAGGVSLDMAGIVQRITIASPGDDLLFGRPSLDGGAGNDTLIGDDGINHYRFGRGYGHDVIKERGGSGHELEAQDSLTLVGLTRSDVTFSRDPADPQTILITITATGETLRLDGSPFDDLSYLDPEDNYNPNGFDDLGAHYIERIIFADGQILSQMEIEQELMDAEATSGNDVIQSFGADRRNPVGVYMDGGAGDDIYRTDFICTLIRWSAGSGSDLLIQTGLARECYIKLAGIQPGDIFVSIELRDGQVYTVLRARDGSELTIPGAPNFGRDIIITAEDGTVHQVRQAGALLANVAATAGDDWLRGQTTGPWGSWDRPTPASEVFDPGAGNDVVAGYGGNDTIRFGRGDGKDVLLDSVNMGPNEDKPQFYTISFKAGVAREDVKVEWAPDGSGNLRISIIGTEDSIIVSPHNFVGMNFAGGHVVRTKSTGDRAEIMDIKALLPAATAGDDILFVEGGKTIDGGAGNDTIYHVQGFDRPNGRSTIVFGRGSGNDILSNATGVALYDHGYFWHNSTNHTLFLKGIQSLDEIRLIRSGVDLIVEIKDTGERLTIKNQILRELSNDYYDMPVSSIELESGDYYYYPWLQDLIIDDDYAGDDEIESAPAGGILDGGAGNDVLKGSVGNDSYILGRGYDEDLVVDAGGSADRVLFEEGVGPGDVVFSRVGANGNDLLIEVLGQDRLTMTISNQFGSAASRIESFVFADGDSLSWAEVQQVILDAQTTSGADVIVGFAAADRIAGGSGGDQLTGLGGNDRIDGGAGRDTAIFRGKSSEYRITTLDGVTTVEDLVAGRDGVDQLINVEDLRFLGDAAETPLVAANRAPAALPGSAATTEDGEIVIARAEILSLATDPDGDALTLTVGGASNGQVWIDRHGDVHFRPAANHAGAASFDYTVRDGNGGTATATYAILVAALNDAPRATATRLEEVFVAEDGTVAIALPAGLFEDSDGPSLVLSLAGVDGGPAPAWLTLASGIITGTPPADFNGRVELRVVASDGEFSAGVAIGLTILPSNDAPAYVSGVGATEVRPGTPFTLDFGAQPFRDVDGDAVAVTLSSADGSPLPAWLSYSNGVLQGTPPSDFEGLDLVLTGSDGRSSSKAYVALQTAENSAPVLVNPVADHASGEDQPVNMLLPADVFADADGDTLSFTLTQAGGAPLPSWLGFAGGRLTGTPPANHHGVLDLLLVASDGSLSASDTFRLTIQPVNDAPELVGPIADFSSSEDQPIDLAVATGGFRDVDGDALSFTLARTDGSPLPSWLSFAAGRLTGTPPADHHGVLDLVLTASDGFLSASDSFRLTIDPVNDAPELVGPIADFSSGEDQPIDLAVPATVFRDADGDALSLQLTQSGGAALPAWLSFANGRLTGTPPANFHGVLDLVLTAGDGSATASDSFRLTIESVNDAPVVALALIDRTVSAADAVDFTVPAATFQDPDGDVLQLTAALANGAPLPSWLSFAAGRFHGQAPAGYSGELLIDVRASDGMAAASDRFSLTIRNANEAPVASGDGQFFTVQGYDLLILQDDVLANDTDPNGDRLSITALGSASHGTVGFDADGKIRYSPDGSFAGSDQFSYTITDGEFVSTASISVRVESTFSDWGRGTEFDDHLFGNHMLVNRLFGAGGNDHIKGGNFADWLAGGEGADHIQGLSGDDHLWGGAGDDKLLGGGGFDIAYFMGTRASYSIVTLNGELFVVDNAPTADGNDGRDAIGSIELLSFKNGETLSVASPIILDLDGNGVETVTASRSRARFDMDGDGIRDDTSWIGRRDAFLFLDRDGNGTVTNIGEMSFTGDLPGAASDLDGLRAFDSNGDGLLSAADARFAEFRLWRDTNGDGVVGRREILGLDEVGFVSMSLTGVAHGSTVAPGDVAIINTGSWTRTDGKTFGFADAAMTFFAGAERNGAPGLRHVFDMTGDFMRGGEPSGVSTWQNPLMHFQQWEDLTPIDIFAA
jgi:Ca2+-binding RTX toxin-like protein